MMGSGTGNRDPFGRKKRAEKEENGWPLDSGWFEGYSTRKEMDEKGKVRFVQYYTGVYYTPDISARGVVTVKAAYAALSALALALFIGAALDGIRGAGEKPMALAQAYCVICMLWLFRKLVSYVATTGKMTIGEYKNTSRSLIRASKAAALGFSSAVVVCLIQVFLNRAQAGILYALGYLGSTLCMAGIAVLESRLKYREILSEEK